MVVKGLGRIVDTMAATGKGVHRGNDRRRQRGAADCLPPGLATGPASKRVVDVETRERVGICRHVGSEAVGTASGSWPSR